MATVLAKGTPSKAQARHSDFLTRTPGRRVTQRRSLGGSSPRLCDRGTPHAATSTPLSPPSRALPQSLAAPIAGAAASAAGFLPPPPVPMPVQMPLLSASCCSSSSSSTAASASLGPLHWASSPPGRPVLPSQNLGSPLHFTQIAVPPLGAIGSHGAAASSSSSSACSSASAASGGSPVTSSCSSATRQLAGLATPANLCRQGSFTPHQQNSFTPHPQNSFTPHQAFCMSPTTISNHSPNKTSAFGSQRVVVSMTPSSSCASASTPSATAAASLSTPSKIHLISTPLRPCSRAKHKEMQDDIKSAVDEHSVSLLRVALQRHHPCAADHALHEAIRQAHVPAVRLLVASRSDPNARCLCLERGCEFPLQLAVTCSSFLRAADRGQVVDLLLRAGAAPGLRRADAEANMPLHDAVRRGDVNVVHSLLRYAADPNALNGFGETPLHVALRHSGGDFVPISTGHYLVDLLLRSGACPLGPGGHGLPAAALSADPELRGLVERAARWWRCRTLAWIRSRSQIQALGGLLPEVCVQVAAFM